MKYTSRISATALMAAAGLLSSPAALALGLGEVTVESYIGQPLKARIELLTRESDDLASVSARLGSAEDYELIGASLDDIAVPVRFSVEDVDGDAYLQASSRLPALPRRTQPGKSRKSDSSLWTMAAPTARPTSPTVSPKRCRRRSAPKCRSSAGSRSAKAIPMPGGWPGGAGSRGVWCGRFWGGCAGGSGGLPTGPTVFWPYRPRCRRACGGSMAGSRRSSTPR